MHPKGSLSRIGPWSVVVHDVRESRFKWFVPTTSAHQGEVGAQHWSASHQTHREAKLSLEIHNVQVSPTQQCRCVPIVRSLCQKSSRMDFMEGFMKPIALDKQHCELLWAKGICGLLESSEEAYSLGEWGRVGVWWERRLGYWIALLHLCTSV